jgi:uncharacterized protein (DUF58 family)
MKVVTYQERKKRFYELLTGAAILLLFILFYLFTPSPVIRLISLTPVLIVVLSFAYSMVVRRSLVLYKDDTVLRGHRRERMKVSLFVENRSALPTPTLAVHDSTGGLFSPTFGRFAVDLGPNDLRELTYEVSGHNRGEYTTGPVEVSGSDPIGLFPFRKRFNEHTRVVVYPNTYPLEVIKNRGLPVGSITSENRIYEDVTQFRSIREYIPGDEMKRINWKATARMGKLYSMEFLPTLYFPVLIFLNLSGEDFPLRHRDKLVERACELAVSFVFYFVSLKLEVGLITTGEISNADVAEENDAHYGTAVDVKSGYSHALRLLETISCATLSKGHADVRNALFRSGVSLPVRTRLLVISPKLKREQAEALMSANRSSYHIEYFEIAEGTERKSEHELGDIRSYIVPDYGEELISEE